MKTLRHTPKAARLNEAGMVSIMVTMILMIVISLLVLGFAQVSRRNQRQSLDRQLSTQAFYAAESGVNDVRNLISTALDNGQVIPNKKSCADTGNGFYSALNKNLTSNVSYSCILVNPSPKELSYNSITDTGTIIPLISGNGTNFSNITIKLTTKTGSTTPSNGCKTTTNLVFTPTTTWTCGYGVLRFDLVPVSGNKTTADLQNQVRTVFAVPYTPSTNAGGNYNFAGDGNAVRGMHCDNTACTLTIEGLSTDKYYMRMQSIYQDVALTMTGKDSNGADATFNGAQIVIDSTGKAEDVLRRIQVHIPADGDGNKNQLPDNALQSTDSVCKRFATMDGYFSNKADTTGDNELCST